jgi:LPXTG-motif cell wall-anchored protein
VTALPETGVQDNPIVGSIGFGSAIIAGSAYINSRRDLLKAGYRR